MSRVIDLFAGVGGLSLGFESLGFEVVLANEYDPAIARAYSLNHPGTRMLVGDIASLDLERTFLPCRGKVDVVVGGPPCQGFSQKGQRRSIHDRRNFLFRYFVDVVRLVRPAYFLMENVPSLLTAEKGFFGQELRSLFGKLGYTLSIGIVAACDFGVPQNRHRAVVMGRRGGSPVPLPPPARRKVCIWDAIGDLAFLDSGEGDEEQPYPYPARTDYQRRMRRGSPVLFNHVATRHSEVALERLAMIPPNAGREALPPEHLTKSIYSGTWTRMRKEDISATITTRFDTPSSGRFTHPFLNRAITVREAARIQSFPDTFRFLGTKASQMKQVGNAVPPLLAQALAQTIRQDMEGN